MIPQFKLDRLAEDDKYMTFHRTLTQKEHIELQVKFTHMFDCNIHDFNSLFEKSTCIGIIEEGEQGDYFSNSLLDFRNKFDLNKKIFIMDSIKGFDSIDEIYFTDVISNLSDIWYPSADDLVIFDESLMWFIFLTHYADVFLFESKLKLLK